MKERIILLIKAKNFTAAQFAEEIGVQKSGISHIISGRNNPSLDFVQKILQRFPEVNMEWLIMGKGPMFSGDTDRQQSVHNLILTPQGSDNRVPDLFSQEISPVKEAIKTDGEDQSPLHSFVENSQPEVESTFPQENPVEDKKEISGEEIRSRPEISKQIEKVLFFYTDKTFQEYFPGV